MASPVWNHLDRSLVVLSSNCWLQILEICVAKYGSIEATMEIVDRRQEEKFSRALGLTAVKPLKKKAESHLTVAARKSLADAAMEKSEIGKQQIPTAPDVQLDLGTAQSPPLLDGNAAASTVNTLFLENKGKRRKQTKHKDLEGRSRGREISNTTSLYTH